MSPVAFDWGGNSEAKGVNSAHEVVGYACTAANARCRAFLFRGRCRRPIPGPWAETASRTR